MFKEDVLLARQPIYDANKELYAYELLFRDNEENKATIFCDSSATSNVLLNLFTDSDLGHVTGGLPAFVNYSGELLDREPIFEPQAIVIEILEHVQITPSLIKRIINLKKAGYTLALDDVAEAAPFKPLLPYIDIVKVELPAYTHERLQKTVEYLKQFDVMLLAEKVETPEEYSLCLELGFDLFQGYFLSKPEIVKGRKLNMDQIGVLNLVSALQDPQTNLESISDIISHDPVISFKLLKLINSAAFRRPSEISSIKSAVSLLGLERIRSWASLLALSKLDNKPDALKYVAIVRAMTCEKLAARVANVDIAECYTSGLLSSLDAFFDQPLADVINEIPLKESIRDALTSENGVLGLVLGSTLKFEQGKIDQINWSALSEVGIEPKDLNDIYFDCSALALEAQGY